MPGKTTSVVRRPTADVDAREASPPESEELLRCMVESATDYAICTADTEGRVASRNGGAARTIRLRGCCSRRRMSKAACRKERNAVPWSRGALRTSAGTCAKTVTRFWASGSQRSAAGG